MDIKDFKCPHCNYALEAATSVNHKGAQPKVDDVSVCFKCASILQFKETGMIHIPQKVLWEIEEKEPNVYKQLRAVQKIINDKNILRYKEKRF